MFTEKLSLSPQSNPLVPTNQWPGGRGSLEHLQQCVALWAQRGSSSPSVQTTPVVSHPPHPEKHTLQPAREAGGSSWGVALCVHCALLPSRYRNCEVTVWVQRWRHSCYSPRPKSYLLLTFNCPPNHFWEDDISGITRSNATSTKRCPLCMQLILDIHQV